MSIIFEDATCIYNKGTPFEKRGVNGISLSIGPGEFVVVSGSPGSGKSTFLHLLGGLLKPTSGRVVVSPSDSPAISRAFSSVGVVFQFPEKQFFEETVYKDISFPLRRAGVSEKDIEARIKTALGSVDIDFQAHRDRAPLELSTGEKRRIAIAAILVLDPETIALDEPFAGLDQKGKKEILRELKRVQEETGKTVIIATQEWEAASGISERFILLEKGGLAGDGGSDLMEDKMPHVSRIPHLVSLLRERGLDLGDGVRDAEEVFQRIREIEER